MAVSLPATVMAMPTGASTAAETEPTETTTVSIQNAQVQSLQLGNATLSNVTIRVLQIDRITIENQSGVEGLNETLAEQRGARDTILLQNATFQNLSLENASAQGLSVAGGPPAGQAGGQQTADTVPQIGNVSNATIARMQIGHLAVEQFNVSDGGGTGSIIQGIADWIEGQFGGGEANATANESETDTPRAGGQPSAAGSDLLVGSVDVEQLDVQRLNVEEFERLSNSDIQVTEETPTANETAQLPNDVPPETTVIGRVTVENSTIESIDVAILSARLVQQQAETETTPADGAGESPTPG